MINEAKMASGRLYVRKLGSDGDWKLMADEGEENSKEDKQINLGSGVMFRKLPSGEWENIGPCSGFTIDDCESTEWATIHKPSGKKDILSDGNFFTIAFKGKHKEECIENLEEEEEEVHNCGNCKDGCRNHSDKDIVYCNQTSKMMPAECVTGCHNCYRPTCLAEMLRNGRLVLATEEQSQKSAPDYCLGTGKIMFYPAPDYKDQEEPSDQELLEILNEEINELLQAVEQANNAESIALRSAEMAIVKNGEYKNTIMALEQKLKERDAKIFQLNTRVFNYALATASAKAIEVMDKFGITAAITSIKKKMPIADRMIMAAYSFRVEHGVYPDNINIGTEEYRAIAMARSWFSGELAGIEDAIFYGMKICRVCEEAHLSCA